MTDLGTQSHIYYRRKRYIPEYREFFAALMKIPDDELKRRVVEAVNGYRTCSVCQNKTEFKSAATQTEIISEILNETECMDTTEDIGTKEKRRRKRKRNCPKVVKTAQHSDNRPVLTQPDTLIQKQGIEPESPDKLSRSISCDMAVINSFDNDFFESQLNEDYKPSNENSTDNIMKQMKIEWDTCDKYNEEGLLPIHEAILKNDVMKLKRQIYVWQHRKVNLMKIVTQDKEDPIQLAIKSNALKVIIDELVRENIDLNGIDDDCNTIIHLAVTHLIPDDIQKQKQLIQTLESFLNKINLEILLEMNDDGMTPLHIAVKHNNFLMVEKILSFMDERLELKGVSHLNDPSADEKKFLQHYCQQCENFEQREQNLLKDKILNAKDMKRGCTVLYFAIELKYEHLVYLLIAHMCNPTTKNLAGQDAKSYYTEYGKNPNIAGALDKLTTFLQK